ncbi:MAG: transporter substrate-binding domain-containing protein [Xenococcaceae cyanobacterium]
MKAAWSKKAYLLIWLAIACIVSAPLPVQAQKLRVGVTGSAPFVIEDGAEFKGISLDIWQEMAQSEGLEYELIPQKNPQASIDAVARGELDVAIGPLSITSERLEKVEFTQPFFYTHISVLLPSQSPTLWSRVKPFFGVAALSSVGFLCLCLFVVGNLIWLTERHQNSEQFPQEYLKGMGNGMWFALVTLTTVGYGDRAPVTKAGRSIAGIWMVVTLVTVSSLTAGLASAFTLSLSELTTERFRSSKDLQDAQMAVVSGTTGVEWAKYYQARLIEAETLQEAIELVLSGRADGAIFDHPALEYYLYQNPELGLRLAGFSLATETYGFALPLDSSLIQGLNVTVVKLYEERRVKDIANKWLKGTVTEVEQ